VLLGALGLVFLLFPVFLRVLWNARPFPCGPMRDRLLAFGARFGRGMNHVLLWNTHRQIANAVVAGFVPRFRVVLLSDGLVENLNEEEVEAVLGHEAGHVVHRHMLLRLLWVLALTLVFCLAYDLGDAVLKAHPLLAPGPGWRLAGGSLLLLTATALFGLLFGRFCRRLERQADVFACRSTSCGHPDCTPHDHRTRRASGSGPLFSFICPTSIETYQSSLEKLARLNGVEPTSPSWQHPSIAQRVADLERFKRNPQLERRPPHSLRRLGAIELLILGGTLLGYFLFSH
jgi:Zn-dependent protease with chaperone function